MNHSGRMAPHRRREHRSRVRFYSKDDFGRRALMVTGLAIGAVVFVAGLWYTRRIWLMAFAGVLFAIFLRSLAALVSRRTGLSDRWSLLVVFFSLVSVFVMAGWLIAEPLSQQVNQLTQRLPEAVEQAQKKVEQWGWTKHLPAWQPSGQVTASAQKALAQVVRVFSSTFEAVAGFLLIVFLGIYLAASPRLYVSGFARLFPVRLRPRVHETLDELGTTLWHWILGQLLAMATVGTLIGVGLAIIGVPLPLVLGLLAGLLEFVPYVGPLVAGTPAVLLAFTLSPIHALWVVGLFLLVNFIEGHFLLPIVNRYSVALPPAITVLALVLMATAFGFLGILLAAPLAAAVLTLVRRIYVQGFLEEREPSTQS